MDLNVVVLSGRLAAEPEHRAFDSGSRLIRYLITVRSTAPRRRVDVVPVTLWDPPEELAAASPPPGSGIWAAGSVQRRFWDGGEGRRSALEVIAHHVDLEDGESGDDSGGG